MPIQRSFLCVISIILLCLDFRAALSDEPPMPEEYAERVGGEAVVLAAGQFQIDGRTMQCGTRRVVVDNSLDDYAAAYPGFLIVNTHHLARVSKPVSRWIFAHECGHQFRGPDEETADCFAVQRGRREGWLDEAGLAQICAFISPVRGDSMHFAGPHRSEAMRACFADPAVR